MSSKIWNHAVGVSFSSGVSFRIVRFVLTWNVWLQLVHFWYGKKFSSGAVIFCFVPQFGHGWKACGWLWVVLSVVILRLGSSSSHEAYIRCSGESSFCHISLSMLRSSFFSFTGRQPSIK